MKSSARKSPKNTATLLAEHDVWEKAQQEAIEKRLTGVEAAVVQINHFTEAVEKLDLGAWKAEIGADVRWLKYLVGVGAAAGAFTALSEALKLLK